jgi:hypothetical protein
MSNLINCPHCHRDFSLDDAQEHQLEAMKIELEKKLQTEIKADSDKRALQWAQEQIAKAKLESEENARKQSIELESLKKFEAEARKKELDFLRQSQEFENMKKNQELNLERARMDERKKLETELLKQAEEKSKFETDKMRLEYEKRMAEMQKQLEMTQKAVEDANRKANQ